MEHQIAILFLAFGLLASLYLTLQIKMELRRSEGNWRKEIEQVRFQMNDQRSSWIQATRKENPLLTASSPLPLPRPVGKTEVAFPLRASVSTPSTQSALVPNSTLWGGSTKAKAIEMVRKGESSTKISAALSLPKPEVEFLMKLQKAAQGN